MSWFPDVQVPTLRGGPVLQWGVLAPGAIAGDFTATVLANTDQKITAVASGSPERGENHCPHCIDDLALWMSAVGRCRPRVLDIKRAADR